MPRPHKPQRQHANKLESQARRLAARLYSTDTDRQKKFADAVATQSARKPAVFWLTEKPNDLPFQTEKIAEWQPDWVDVLTDPNDQPARHPLYESGAYYPLDFSSVTTASALLAIDIPTGVVLDVCSSPGGKALFAWRALRPESLLCNEVIGKRHRALHENLSRCNVPAEVLQLDPSQLSERYSGACDVVLVDAPCSGQSLIARGLEASGAFQDHLINMNMARQRRILAHSAACVTNGGYLLYTTCTYSREENEKNIEWLIKTLPEFEPAVVPHLEPYRSTLTELACYRLEPQHGLGAGGFSALLRKS